MCIKALDSSLYDLLQRCLAVESKRPSAEELLSDHFFQETKTTDIDLSKPRVLNHVNSKWIIEHLI